MLKLGRMRRQTLETFVDPTAMLTQMRKVSGCYSVQPLTTLYCTTLVLTNHLEDGHGTAQKGNTTIRLITSWQGSASVQELTSIGLGVSGSRHRDDLVMTTFRVRLEKARKPTQLRLRLYLQRLRDPDVACTFQTTIGGNLHHLFV